MHHLGFDHTAWSIGGKREAAQAEGIRMPFTLSTWPTRFVGVCWVLQKKPLSHFPEISFGVPSIPLGMKRWLSLEKQGVDSSLDLITFYAEGKEEISCTTFYIHAIGDCAYGK